MTTLEVVETMAGNKKRLKAGHRLRRLIGDEDFLRLVEEFGGTRVYVPHQRIEGTVLCRVIGEKGVKRLFDNYGGLFIRVPVARAFRAVTYRKQGMSNGRIASCLGITEPGVNQLFKRLGV